jgi:sortase A
VKTGIGIARLRPLLAALIIVAAAALVSELTRPYRPDNPIDEFIDSRIGRDWAQSELDTVETAQISYDYVEMPADSKELDGLLYITGERSEYEDGAMTLVLPKLGLELPVSDGTARADLKVGPGLFEHSNMPGEGNRNVSIAGHRSRKFFYDLDKVGEGDTLSLIYGGYRFNYIYLDTKVILPTDWSVIMNQGFSSCTLITCTPVGVANRRMVARFELVGAEPYPAGAGEAGEAGKADGGAGGEAGAVAAAG